MESRDRSNTASLVEISRELSLRVSKIGFGPPVTHVYNPLEYAWSRTRSTLIGLAIGVVAGQCSWE